MTGQAPEATATIEVAVGTAVLEVERGASEHAANATTRSHASTFTSAIYGSPGAAMRMQGRLLASSTCVLVM